MNKFSSLLVVSLLSGTITLGAYKLLFDTNSASGSKLSVASDNYSRNVGLGAENVDFTTAAENAVHYVVHVKNVSVSEVPSNPIMEYFYGYRGGQQQTQIGTGSGVIISEDGYIVTNNHVIQNATELEVTLNNNKTYKAKLVGTDSKMDVALLKVEADEKLPYATFGDSDNIKVGEWVLAVGNPYNLNSTVTAGIVSAKARDLSNTGIQSFIQTDAAVNPGNSGGALVNTRGELVGINTMISSQTGSYVGYSFAVPSNITRKIIEDLMEYGNVQRGVLGVAGGELNSMAAKEFGVKETQGFYINSISKNSGAEKSGLKKGDIIVQLDNQQIKGYSDLTAYINTKRPNDVVQVGILREGDRKTIPVKLTKKELVNVDYEGFEFEEIDAADKKRFKLNEGVKIKDVTNERYLEYANILKGSIILRIDGAKISSMEQASRILNSKSNNQKFRVEVITQSGERLQMLL
ncbi:serine protease precursor [Flavobacterium cauense R2A-7]|uniref:Do/DeqQ family serine protease n=1 Tax=Flavobacterium cauense R2A-7 TaxID=1341154 RepID=V6RYL8_9FLAO|nr:Do family serine endopeptidase [Flavobacterium cauense]ESU19581.1 serine protease precursor [Flavobacterium cauense R2A-7]KGO84105.1 serine protease [Flavobacterium cauense R2A-7]TWI14546.1 Do/DeqQ family serine protease [Flavobacterium cauense R2A-7]